MLGLVVATNIFQMYLVLGVGGCFFLPADRFLLYEVRSAIAASKKAFIVTRFADLGFLIGILVYGYYTGTYTFAFTPVTMALLKGGGTI